MENNEWSDQSPAISTEALKRLIAEMRLAYSEYEKVKDQANRLKEKYDALEDKVANTLQAAGLKRFDVPGLGSCTLASKFSVRVPKELASKRALFQYISKQYGADVLDEFRTINYQTLNAWFNKEAEANGVDRKEFSVPGLDAPTEEHYIQFRKDKAGE